MYAIIIGMSDRKINFVEGEYYHLYNRGNSKQKIFRDRNDHRRFIKSLYLANSNKNFVFREVEQDIYSFERGGRLISIGAYCLMPNHFHLLITPTRDGDVSSFMKKLATSYSMYFNTKYKRTGTLFEGKFKSEHVDSDRYLKYLFSYIHLNPVKLIDSEWKEREIQNKNKTLDFLSKYEFSSYPDYLKDSRLETSILNREQFPKYFPNQKSFEKEILDWITFT
jgi:REP element-mobilizing transposase RayT